MKMFPAFWFAVLLMLFLQVSAPAPVAAHIDSTSVVDEKLQTVEVNGVRVELAVEPQLPRVGEPAQIQVHAEDASMGKLLKNVDVRVQIIQIEDEFTALSFRDRPTQAATELNYVFGDGTPHSVIVEVSSTPMSPEAFDPISAEFTINAQPIEPPAEVQGLAMSSLMLVPVAGVIAGAVVTSKLSRRPVT